MIRRRLQNRRPAERQDLVVGRAGVPPAAVSIVGAALDLLARYEREPG